MLPTNNTITNPITGIFGTGQVAWFNSTTTWTVPQGIGKVRVRLWGGGAGSGGGGGGFAMKTIQDLSGVSTIAVTVGAASGTSSFGSYVSATGASTTTGGSGVGGDVNSSGGNGTSSYGGGGTGSLFGAGGAGGGSTNSGSNSTGGAGGGAGGNAVQYVGGSGFIGTGGTYYSTTVPYTQPTSALSTQFSIDFLGTGGGGAGSQSGINGGGGGVSNSGGFPGGGGGGSPGVGAPGLVIVEW